MEARNCGHGWCESFVSLDFRAGSRGTKSKSASFLNRLVSNTDHSIAAEGTQRVSSKIIVFTLFSNARENLPCFTEAVCSACLKLLFWEKTCLGHICSLPHEGLTIICGKSLAWSHFRCWGKLRTRSNCEHNSSTQAFFLSICLQRVNKMQSSLHYLHLARAKVSYFRIASWRSHHFLMG